MESQNEEIGQISHLQYLLGVGKAVVKEVDATLIHLGVLIFSILHLCVILLNVKGSVN